ncbi:MAG: ABC transporter permease [Marinobacter sp.]
MSPLHYWHCFAGIQLREWRRFWQQRNRFATALIRPILWLFILASGLGLSTKGATLPGASGPVSYQMYLIPGLCAMVILFNSMQSALSMVYDRELGSMRVLLVSPLPRPFLLFAKLLAMGSLSVIQVLVFLAVTWAVGFRGPPAGYITAIPALFVSALMLGALGLVIATWIRQLENFAGVMNFVIFPVFFLSSALYPLENFAPDSPILFWAGLVNPFTHAVEAIRFSLSAQWHWQSFSISVFSTLVLCLIAIQGFQPQRTRILGSTH